uniref:CLEC16A/TT9 C-terminal domain-containing protein n=1 Tax=Parascaris equorum TaxID=6256 RepID=A0A914RZW6_PAREQ
MTHSVDIDQFARSAENEASNRDRLADLVGEHLDHIHYLNDIFLIQDDRLSAMLSEIVFGRLLAPLYLCSLASLRMCPSAVILTPVTSLFLLSHFLLIVTDQQVAKSNSLGEVGRRRESGRGRQVGKTGIYAMAHATVLIKIPECCSRLFGEV